MFKCDCCPRQFNSQHAVNQHMDALGHRLPRFNCETCDKAFFSQHAANQHMNDTGYWGPRVEGNSGPSFSSAQAWYKQGWVGKDDSGQSTSSGLFGNGRQSTPRGGLFSSSRTLSDQSPSSGLFGQGYSSGQGLFGQGPSSFTGGLFGQSTFSGQRTAALRLFGQNLATAPGLFGQSTTGQGSSSGQGIFGGRNPVTAQSLFGQNPVTTQDFSSGSRFCCETCNMEFWSQNDADLHREGFRHKKPSMIDDIERVQELVAYLNRGEARVLFHGTQRARHVGDPNYALRVCNNTECRLCGILRDGFKLDWAKSTCMFGPGIYTTDVSSKADNWVMNHHMHSKLHVMLLCAVSVGKSEKLYRADHGRKGPSTGYQSVEGAVIAEGGVLHEPEIVLYSENLVVPFGMIVYTREGWQPF
ncbi:Hypothetical protein NCS54_00494600 [Fusarium falciforme]|uniref:Hypothetical protein n=1 Tax=Fusarium falciforme TaxID=195108 RepID=UPI002301DA52|nr:Hypothetical protein NCS54_00494600 [Fusarium falciforme]WAO87630.1 Hypothetical protein NCS54_00494600 [Fusarium falciforme]